MVGSTLGGLGDSCAQVAVACLTACKGIECLACIV